MVTFYIDKDEVSWKPDDNSIEFFELNAWDLEQITDRINGYVTQILLFEHMMESENLKISIMGDELVDFEFMVYKENISVDRSTDLFMEFVIARKDRLVREFKRYLNELLMKDYDIKFSKLMSELINRHWTISSDYKLKSYQMIDEI